MMKMKRIASAALALILCAALALPAAASGFTDIPAGSTLAGDVEKANSYGLMGGYSSNIFGYGDSMTRAQFATVLGRMLGWLEGPHTDESHITEAMQVSGVSGDYMTAIEMAVRNDAVDTDVPFRPNAAITRGEMAEMLVRALGLKSAAALAAGDSLPFTDVTAADRGYVSVAYAIGMANGISAAEFAPGRTATRAQAAAMLVRIYEKLQQKTDYIHGFYAISSYSQIGLTKNMDDVSAGWSRMTWDGSKALLSTTSANQNEYMIPSGYGDAVSYWEQNHTLLNLSVFMGGADGVKELLASETGRAQAVDEIINELTVSYQAIGRNPYSGVTIDFEGLRSGQKANFTAFLTLLSSQVNSLHKTLYVCVSPVLTTGSYYDGYDYRAIGELADRVILMAYDYDARDLTGYVGTEYYKTAAPAPIDQVYASLRAITDPSSGVQDHGKIVLGFSCKPVAWQIDTNGKLLAAKPLYPSIDTVGKRLAQSDTLRGWSSSYQMPYATYSADGTRYFLWYEDNAAVSAKLRAARLLGITGISLWRLGNIPTDGGWNWNGILS